MRGAALGVPRKSRISRTRTGSGTPNPAQRTRCSGAMEEAPRHARPRIQARRIKAICGAWMSLQSAGSHSSQHARFAPAGTLPPRLADCIRQKIVPARAAAGADWTSVVFVHEVATWAYRVAKGWVEESEQLL